MKTPAAAAPVSTLAACALLLAAVAFAPGCATILASDDAAAPARNSAFSTAVASAPIYFETSTLSSQQQRRYLPSWQAVFVGQKSNGATLRILEEGFSSVSGPEDSPAMSTRPALHYEVKAELIVDGRSIILRESQVYQNVPSIRRDGRPRGVDDRMALVAWTAELLAKKANSYL